MKKWKLVDKTFNEWEYKIPLTFLYFYFDRLRGKIDNLIK